MILTCSSANADRDEVPLAFRVVGVISVLANAQDTANATVRSLVDNMMEFARIRKRLESDA